MKALTRTEKKAREDAIVLAATRVLSGSGFEALTMEEVAREAGLAKGTLFLYFRNKEELVLAVFSGMAEALGGALRAVAASDLPPREILRGIIFSLLEHFDKKRDITGYSGGLPLTGPGKEELRSRFAANMEAIAAALERCAEKGLVELDDPLFAASALFGLCRGSNTYARAAGHKLPLEERARRVTRIFLDGTRNDK